MGKAWSWAGGALRPSSICGFAVGNPMNMATVIAVYAALCKEMRLPLRFPGSTAAYRAVMEMTDAELLAKAIVWAGENDSCDGHALVPRFLPDLGYALQRSSASDRFIDHEAQIVVLRRLCQTVK